MYNAGNGLIMDQVLQSSTRCHSLREGPEAMLTRNDSFVDKPLRKRLSSMGDLGTPDPQKSIRSQIHVIVAIQRVRNLLRASSLRALARRGRQLLTVGLTVAGDEAALVARPGPPPGLWLGLGLAL